MGESRPLRVFVSSTWEDLQPEREAVEKALHRMRETTFVGMEYFGSRPNTPRDVSLMEVERSDVYIGLFAHRYGSGITEEEYRRAFGHNIPCLIYIKDDSVPVPPDQIERDPAKRARLDALKGELKSRHTVSFFKGADNLATQVVADLHNLFGSSPSTSGARSDSPGPKYQIIITHGEGIAIGDNAQIIHHLKAKGYDEATIPDDESTKAERRLSRSQESLKVAEARYIGYLKRQYSHVPLGGIAPRVQDRMLSIPLEELFVPLQAEADAPLRAQFVMSGVRGLQAPTIDEKTRVGLAEIVAPPRVVILGEPGAGKSTLLRWVVFQALQTSIPEEGSGLSARTIPIFVRLVDFAAMLEKQTELTFAEYLREWHLSDYAALFAELLETGRGWLLLDGLDEVADPRLRRRVRDAIDTFAAQYQNFRLIVTSRIVGYRSAQLQGSFRHFTLQPFGRDEIASFIRNWFRSVYRLAEKSPKFIEADQRAERLLERLEEKPRVFQLAGTPLLLAIIALMDWKGKEIPRRRVELYEIAMETLLEAWPEEQRRPIEGDLSIAEMFQILAPLGFEIFEWGNGKAIRLEKLELRVIELIASMRQCSEEDARLTAHRWLGFLNEQSGLLLEIGVDEFYHPVYAFLHLSFVEYLSGRELARRWRDDEIDLIQYVNDPRWREVVLLMAGHIGMESVADASHLVAEIYGLEPPHHDVLHQSLVLAAACLADDVQIAPDLRARILDELIILWHSNTHGLLRSKLFRIIAAMRGTESAREIIERITPLLDDRRTWVRSSVVELLGKLGRTSDLALKTRLLDVLHTASSEVQQAGVRALETLGLGDDPNVRAEFLRALELSNADVRTRAVLALRSSIQSDTRVMPALVKILAQDENRNVRQMAGRVLGAVQQPDEHLVTGMLNALNDADSGVRKEASANLMRWGNRSHERLVVTLLEMLQNPNVKERRSAIKVIADTAAVLGQEAIDLMLTVATTDKNPSMRATAIQWLGTVALADDKVVRLMVDGLKSTDRVARRYSALGLKRLGLHDREVTEALVVALRDEDLLLRRYAAEALATCGLLTRASIDGLEETLSDGDEFVRLFAAEALVGLAASSLKGHEALVTLLQSRRGEVRRRAANGVRVLIHCIDPSIVVILTELVKDSNRDVREQALLALGELGHRASLQIVVACRTALRDDYHWVRMRAAEALGKIAQSDNATVDDLVTALADSNGRVRLAASEALIELSEGPQRERIIERVRALLDKGSNPEEAINTLWGVVVGNY